MGVRIALPLQNIKGYDLVMFNGHIRTLPNCLCQLKVKMSKFVNSIKESYTELTKKVSWPSWNQLQNSAIVVMVASLIFAVVIFAMDFAFQHLMTAIYNL